MIQKSIWFFAALALGGWLTLYAIGAGAETDGPTVYVIGQQRSVSYQLRCTDIFADKVVVAADGDKILFTAGVDGSVGCDFHHVGAVTTWSARSETCVEIEPDNIQCTIADVPVVILMSANNFSYNYLPIIGGGS